MSYKCFPKIERNIILQGPMGYPGIGIRGKIGTMGPIGLPGPSGVNGLPGVNGIINFSNFHALMPGDNSVTVAPGTSISFPGDGVTNSIITRVNDMQFNLPNIGVYEIYFQVSITEPGQLCVVLNGVEDPTTIVGRATGTSQLVGFSLIKTTIINSVLSINNPIGETTALTITPIAGGTNPVSANLIIKQIA